MKYFALMLVAMATVVSCQDAEMMELTPAVSSSSNCDVSLWCQDRATAERCDKVSYCTKWIWSEVPVQEVSNEACDLCKQFFTAVLASNETEIKTICEILVLWKNCSVFLHDEIKGESPAKICEQIGVCSQTADLTVPDILNHFLSELQRQPELPGSSCDECKSIFDVILNNTDEIEKFLDDICSKAPGPIKIACDFLVKEVIIEVGKLNSTYICQKFKFCNLPQLLGADMCTRGPAYWCASLDNAKECEAFDFCNEEYWVF